ncbi:MAG: hypothetical protein JWO38_1248 [Gemmataceae bacterium]|nr:hypothetical protein [Gemmataceae bacterium]
MPVTAKPGVWPVPCLGYDPVLTHHLVGSFAEGKPPEPMIAFEQTRDYDRRWRLSSHPLLAKFSSAPVVPADLLDEFCGKSAIDAGRFAKRYGPLIGLTPLKSVEGRKPGAPLWGEPFRLWENERQLMRRAKHLSGRNVRVQNLVNDRLAAHARTVFSSPPAVLDPIPLSLLGALWLQVARSFLDPPPAPPVKTTTESRVCENPKCKKAYLAIRSTRKYCNPVCKAIAHRELRRKVEQMFHSGLEPDDIADRLGLDYERVRGWDPKLTQW